MEDLTVSAKTNVLESFDASRGHKIVNVSEMNERGFFLLGISNARTT